MSNIASVRREISCLHISLNFPLRPIPSNKPIWPPSGQSHMGFHIWGPYGTPLGNPVWVCPYGTHLGYIIWDPCGQTHMVLPTWGPCGPIYKGCPYRTHLGYIIMGPMWANPCGDTYMGPMWGNI